MNRINAMSSFRVCAQRCDLFAFALGGLTTFETKYATKIPTDSMGGNAMCTKNFSENGTAMEHTLVPNNDTMSRLIAASGRVNERNAAGHGIPLYVVFIELKI